MSLCFDCGKTNKDEALEKAKQKARQAAIAEKDAKAVYLEGGEYKYISAMFAVNNGIPYIVIMSAYE